MLAALVGLGMLQSAGYFGLQGGGGGGGQVLGGPPRDVSGSGGALGRATVEEQVAAARAARLAKFEGKAGSPYAEAMAQALGKDAD